MIVVTGGAGFIGSAIVWGLNQANIKEDILIVDHLDNKEKWKNLRGLYYTDYMEKDDFIKSLDHLHISKIIHMGACSATTELDASYLVKNNYEYTKILADYAVQNCIRFIYASSAATYGDGDYGFDDEVESLNKLRPLNMYGYSKQMFDLYAKQKGYFNKIVGLKFFNVFGPNEYHKDEMTSKVYKAFYEMKKNGSIKLFKSANKDWQDGAFVRDFIYVKDVVKAIIELLKQPEINGLFNIGTGKSRSWNDLAGAVSASMAMPKKLKYVDMPEYLKEKYQYHTEANNKKLLDSGINIKYHSLEEAIDDYIKNYLIPGNYLGDE